jgi:hypothetical protein
LSVDREGQQPQEGPVSAPAARPRAGVQSLRNRTCLPLWEAFTGFVGTGLLLAGVFVAAGGRGPRFDRTEEAIGGTFFALGGLMCVLWAYAQLRRRRPLRLSRRLPGISVAADRDEKKRGEEISVTLTLAPHTGAGDEHLEVGLVCSELYDHDVTVHHRGGTTVVRQTLEATAHQDWRGIEPAAGERTFTFRIPRDAPYSYEGECVSYAWRVSARFVRDLRPDPRLDHPIWVRS